jgi:two-component sensor histidine kinase
MSLFALVRRAIAAPKTPLFQASAAILAVAVAALIRWVIDRGANGTPFVTFMPVVVISAVLLQWPYAVLAALASLVTVVVLFGETARIQLTPANQILWGTFVFLAGFIIVVGHILRETILELEAQAATIRGFNAELQHRTKNTLQIVRALASRAMRTTDPVEFYETLAGRLDSLVRANELLGSSRLEPCEAAELIRVALQPFPIGAFQADGPPCMIAGEPGKQLMMALHELATNAVKYGALSVDGGHVVISWTVEGDQLDLFWQERGGPPVRPPTKAGLGTRILSPGGGLRAVDLDYRPDGVACRISVACGTAPRG